MSQYTTQEFVYNWKVKSVVICFAEHKLAILKLERSQEQIVGSSSRKFNSAARPHSKTSKDKNKQGDFILTSTQ